MMKRPGNTVTVFGGCLLVLALLAGSVFTPAQPSEKKEPAKTQRTYSDEDLAKYKTKGNLTQSTTGKPKPAAKAEPAKPAEPVSKDTPFNANLGTEGKALRDEFVAAHKQAEAARKASEPLVKRWGELHKRLAESRSPDEREKLKSEIKTLEASMGKAIQESNQADERYLNALEKANQAGVLNSTARQGYEKDKAANKEKFTDGR